ncbi:MAG: ABC transporter ATP-binding protein [Acidilobaceae archaeon]
MKCSIKLEGVSVKLDGRLVLRDINLEINSSITAIIGPNGAGKTTLLRVIAGIVKPTSGYVNVCDMKASRASKLIAYVPAYLQVDPYATVEDVIKAYTYDIVNPIDPIEALEYIGYSSLAGRRFNTLSGGEHKLVLLAGALARRPRILLLDEPYSHLDLANQYKLSLILRREAEKGTIIVSTIHEPYYANIANNLVVMSSGLIVAYGAPSIVLSRELLEKIYGVEMIEVLVESNNLILPKLF